MIHTERFASRVLRVETYFLIAVPDGARPLLPAVVLLRGAPEEWLDARQDSTRAGRTVLFVAEDLVRKGYSHPLAFVLPRTANSSFTGFVSHGRALRPDLLGDRTYLGTCELDRFLDEEVLPRSYSSGLVREGAVSIDGFSLGGASTVYHALRRPELFRSCGSFDGAFLELVFDEASEAERTLHDACRLPLGAAARCAPGTPSRRRGTSRGAICASSLAKMNTRARTQAPRASPSWLRRMHRCSLQHPSGWNSSNGPVRSSRVSDQLVSATWDACSSLPSTGSSPSM